MSAHTHSSTAILQHQRAGLRVRTSRSIAVIIIIIFAFNIIIILCISSANRVLKCRSVGRSIASGCRCAPLMQLSGHSSHQQLSKYANARAGNIARPFSWSARPSAALFSSLRQHHSLFTLSRHPRCIQRPGAHQTRLSLSRCSSLVIFISDRFFFLTTILQHASSVIVLGNSTQRVISCRLFRLQQHWPPHLLSPHRHALCISKHSSARICLLLHPGSRLDHCAQPLCSH